MLWQPTIDESYQRFTPDELATRIADRRARLGERLVILGHHYQQNTVVQHADLTGDSLKLSQLAATVADEKPVGFIVFCGVHFMAETADMLTPEPVRVLLPDLSAGCSMADMADIDDTQVAWDTIHDALSKLGWTGRVIPITYVNSTAAIKAFVGRCGGACCTSSNADQVFDWAIKGGTQPAKPGEEIKILFLPDQHLGRNTAAAYGIDTDAHTCTYDPRLSRQGEPLGGATPNELLDAKVILWAGHCSVHQLFRPEHCIEIKESNAKLGPNETPERIIVHPECSKQVVDLADLSGSTEFILKTIEASEPGSRWAVGTEVHLVNRLRDRMGERGVEVRMLSSCQCLCTTMYRIDQPHLLWVLDGLCGLDADGAETPVEVRNEISVPTEVRAPALLSVNRMLELIATPSP